MNLVKINPKDYGLTETKAAEVSAMFNPMLEKMVELEKEFNEVANLEINEDAVLKAKELRLKYVKVRTGTAAIHKELKSFYLQGGRFVDGWKNAQLMASQGIEGKLLEIENHYINLEKERIEKLQNERANELVKFDVEIIPNNIGAMPGDVWNNYIFGVKANFEAAKEAERIAEEQRLKAIEEEKKERERIRLENERLKKEAEERERLAKVEAEKRAKAEKERIAKEREAYEAKLKAEREERAKVERIEREKIEKLEAEIRSKAESERKAKEAEEKRIQSELSKGDAAKVKDLISDLQALKDKYSFKSVKNKAMYAGVGQLIDKVITFINK